MHPAMLRASFRRRICSQCALSTASRRPHEKDNLKILRFRTMAEHCSRIENESGALLGLDVSPSKVGLSVTDETRTVALPLKLIHRMRKDRRRVPIDRVAAELEAAVKEQRVCGLVVGWPLEKDGVPGLQCAHVLRFLRAVHRERQTLPPVMLWDEMWSTKEARDALRDANVRRADVAELHDMTAAAIILQGFLDGLAAQGLGLSTLDL